MNRSGRDFLARDGAGEGILARPRSASEWRQSVSKATRLAATVSARTAKSDASAGLRRHHRLACSSFETDGPDREPVEPALEVVRGASAEAYATAGPSAGKSE